MSYFPKAFRVSYETDVHHRRDTFGGMDSEYSHTTREKTSELVIAPDLETAQFLWDHRKRRIDYYTDISWEELGNVSLMIAGAYGL